MSEKITSYDLATSAVSLSGAIADLASFADDRINSVEVKREDLSALHGLLDAVVLFARHHEELATKYFDDGLFKDEAIELQNNLE
ncbi:hypothetical protein [Enterococcus dispar]|uniref:hypothetical protein n=1 Tax=Enterococcus dispar TaxID=44009 RepID=UPI0024937725|nr:hypothetical protein [Enterococcus dispar]